MSRAANIKALLLCLLAVLVAMSGCASMHSEESRVVPMQIHYLEIVTPDVEAVCETYAAAHGISFSEPVQGLGNARTASMPSGGLVGVRAPMHESEHPIVRPYWLVDDIESAVAKAEAEGCMIAHPPLNIPGYGTFAIYFTGEVQHGLWQLETD